MQLFDHLTRAKSTLYLETHINDMSNFFLKCSALWFPPKQKLAEMPIWLHIDSWHWPHTPPAPCYTISYPPGSFFIYQLHLTIQLLPSKTIKFTYFFKTNVTILYLSSSAPLPLAPIVMAVANRSKHILLLNVR